MTGETSAPLPTITIPRERLTLDDFEYRVGRLTLAPGDVLVLKIDAILPGDLIGRIGREMRQYVPQPTKILVLDASADISVLTRAEIEARAS